MTDLRALLSRLIRCVDPRNIRPDFHANTYLETLNRPVDSKLCENDWDGLMELIRGKLAQEGSNRDLDLFSIRFQKFLASSAIKKKWKLMYFIYQVSLHNGSKKQPYNPGQSLELCLPETLLVKEMIYLLQGAETNHVCHDNLSGIWTIDPLLVTSVGNRNIIASIIDLARLGRELEEFCHQEQKMNEMVYQSLCDWIRSFLEKEYYKRVAVFKSMIVEESGMKQCTKGLGMRGLFVLTQDCMFKCRLVRQVMDSVAGKRGSEIVNVVYHLSQNGDTRVSSLVQSILKDLIMPVVDMIQDWIYRGVQGSDEFFIIQCRDSESTPIWEQIFSLQRDRQPFFVDQELGTAILGLGRLRWLGNRLGHNISIENVLCEDVAIRLVSDGQDVDFRMIHNEYQRVGQNLLAFLSQSPYWIKERVLFLHEFMIGRRGDFVQNLIDNLGIELEKAECRVDRHFLLKGLDQAIRDTGNDTLLTKFVNQIDIKIFPAKESRDGWEVFGLDYRVDFPIGWFFSGEIMEQYRQVSRFMWRLKMCEHFLNRFWKRWIIFGRKESLWTHNRELAIHSRLLLMAAEMRGFVTAALDCVVLKVIDKSWNRFREETGPDPSFDEYRIKHMEYMMQMDASGWVCPIPGSNRLLKQLHYRILRIITTFIGTTHPRNVGKIGMRGQNSVMEKASELIQRFRLAIAEFVSVLSHHDRHLASRFAQSLNCAHC